MFYNTRFFYINKKKQCYLINLSNFKSHDVASCYLKYIVNDKDKQPAFHIMLLIIKTC